MTAPIASVNDAFARLVDAAQLIADEFENARFDRALSHLRPLLRPEIVRELVELELAALASRGTTTKSPSPGDLRIRSGSAFDVRVRIVQPQAASGTRIKTLSRHTLVGNAGRAAFTIERWCQPVPEPNDLFDARKIIERNPDIVVEPGEAVALRAGVEAFEIIAGKRPAVAVLAGGAHVVSLAWIHRRDTGRPVSLEPATRDWLMLRELLAFAEALSESSLVPAIAQLEQHPSHFVRWCAAKSSMKLAPHSAASTLRTLADDPHPQIRTAARHLLGEPKQ